MKSVGFLDGTIGKDPRFQATRLVEITHGTCGKGEGAKPRTEVWCGKVDLTVISVRFSSKDTHHRKLLIPVVVGHNTTLD